jgi:tetratricopeptide (TPR) repeat protein
MKVLLELLEDAASVLENLDDVDTLRPQSQRRLRELLEKVSEESARLLREVDESVDNREGDGRRQERDGILERGLAALARDRLEEAKSILRDGVESFPEDVELLTHLGLACWEQGAIEEAEEWYQRAMSAGLVKARQVEGSTCRALSRGYFRAVEGRALCLRRLGEAEEAISLFDALGTMAPGDYAGCHYLAGEILHEENRLREAIEAYGRATEEPAVHYNLGLARFQLGDHRQAATTLIRGFVANPHIAARLLDAGPEVQDGAEGYLGSAAYADEFVDACRQLWAENPEAKRFMEHCFEHPLVRHHLEQIGARSEQHDEPAADPMASSMDVGASEPNVVAGIARTIVERTDQ